MQNKVNQHPFTESDWYLQIKFCKHSQRITIQILQKSLGLLLPAKGEIKPKTDWRAIDSPKKEQSNLFFSHDSGNTWNLKFQFQVFPDCKAKKTNSFVWFLGESMERQSAYDLIWPLHKLIFSSRQNVIKKRKNMIAEMIFTPLCPLYRSINFLNLLRSGTKLELSTLFFSYRLIFFKGPTSSISSKKCQKSSILFR